MTEKQFHLGTHEYIELKNLLKLLDYVNSGGEVKFFVIENDIYVNGEIEKRRGRKLRSGDKISFLDNIIIVNL